MSKLLCTIMLASCPTPETSTVDTCPWEVNSSIVEHNQTVVRSEHFQSDDPFCATYPITNNSSPRADNMPMFLIRALARAEHMSVPNWLHRNRNKRKPKPVLPFSLNPAIILLTQHNK